MKIQTILLEAVSVNTLFKMFGSIFKYTRFEKEEKLAFNIFINYIKDRSKELYLALEDEPDINIRFTTDDIPRVFVEKFFSTVKNEIKESSSVENAKKIADIIYEMSNGNISDNHIKAFTEAICFILALDLVSIHPAKKNMMMEEIGKRLLSIKRIFNYDYNSLNNLLNKSREEVITYQKEKLEKKVELNKIFEDDQIKVYKIESFMDCVRLGKGTKWCVSSIKDGEKHFKFYSMLGDMYVFILKNHIDEAKREEKYLLTVVKPESFKLIEDIGEYLLFEDSSSSPPPIPLTLNINYENSSMSVWSIIKEIISKYTKEAENVVNKYSSDNFLYQLNFDPDNLKKENLDTLTYLLLILLRFVGFDFNAFSKKFEEYFLKDKDIMFAFYKLIKEKDKFFHNLSETLNDMSREFNNYAWKYFLPEEDKGLIKILEEFEQIDYYNKYNKEQHYLESLYRVFILKILNNLQISLNYFTLKINEFPRYYLADKQDEHFILPDIPEIKSVLNNKMYAEHYYLIQRFPQYQNLLNQIREMDKYINTSEKVKKIVKSFSIVTTRISSEYFFKNIENLMEKEEDKNVIKIYNIICDLKKYSERQSNMMKDVFDNKLKDLFEIFTTEKVVDLFNNFENTELAHNLDYFEKKKVLKFVDHVDYHFKVFLNFRYSHLKSYINLKQLLEKAPEEEVLKLIKKYVITSQFSIHDFAFLYILYRYVDLIYK